LKRRAQVVVAAVLLIALYVMSILVMVYQAHAVFLQTRSPVAREIVASITGDFQRALAAMLAVATRAYFNYSRFSDLTGRFSNFGMSYYNRHNFTVARQVAKTFLEYWRQSVTKAYAEYGIQVSYSLERLDVSQYLNRSRAVYDLMKGYWYLPASGSYAYAKLRMNLTRLGLYNWESEVFVGLTVRVYRTPVSYNPPSSSSKGNVSLTINVLFDRGEYYGNLLAKGWVEIYYPEKVGNTYTGRWLKATIKDVRYDGMGNYTITFEPYVDILTVPLTEQQYVPVMVVVSDERGILVEASTYNYIGFAVQKNTPNTLYYYDSSGKLQSFSRPTQTPFEVYTLEMSSNLSFYWLGSKLAVSSSLKLPPFPVMPIKQIRVNVSSDGTKSTLQLRPIQYENWTTVGWHGLQIRLPVGLSDPQMDFVKGDNFNTVLVFQVQFPAKSITKQYVLLWWSDDLDADPINFSTRIKYISPDQNSSYNDVFHPLFDLEFLDARHKVARGFENAKNSTDPCNSSFDPDYHLHYGGIAAINLRSPDGRVVYGPINLHGFGVDSLCGTTYLASYRPYGSWSVFYKYLRYGYPAPVRIFVLLNTTLVADIYTLTQRGGNAQELLRSDYYHIVTLVEVINGTNYLPIISYVYWNGTQSGNGYWALQVSGVQQPNIPNWGSTYGYFSYLTYPAGSYRENSTDGTPVSSSPQRQTFTGSYPGIFISQWGNQSGKAIIFNKITLNYWYNLSKNVSGQVVTSSFKCGDIIPLCSADIHFIRLDSQNRELPITITKPLTFSYQTVIFVYNLTDSWRRTDGWKNGYVYTPMFLEKYSPTVVPP